MINVHVHRLRRHVLVHVCWLYTPEKTSTFFTGDQLKDQHCCCRAELVHLFYGAGQSVSHLRKTQRKRRVPFLEEVYDLKKVQITRRLRMMASVSSMLTWNCPSLAVRDAAVEEANKTQKKVKGDRDALKRFLDEARSKRKAAAEPLELKSNLISLCARVCIHHSFKISAINQKFVRFTEHSLAARCFLRQINIDEHWWTAHTLWLLLRWLWRLPSFEVVIYVKQSATVFSFWKEVRGIF